MAKASGMKGFSSMKKAGPDRCALLSDCRPSRRQEGREASSSAADLVAALSECSRSEF